jgi:hypothetical protein
LHREENREELRSNSSASFDRRWNSSLRHPGISWHSHSWLCFFFYRWERSVRVIFELLLRVVVAGL